MTTSQIEFLTWHEWIALVIALADVADVNADPQQLAAVQAVCESAGVQW